MKLGYCCKCDEYTEIGEHDDLCEDCYSQFRNRENQEAAARENDPDAERCIHCGAALPRFQNVVDSGEPLYLLGVICPSCGRFVPLDGDDWDESDDQMGPKFVGCE